MLGPLPCQDVFGPLHRAGDYYNTGGCYVGLAPLGVNAWEPFNATFTPPVSLITVYINQQSTSFSSIVSSLNVQQLIAKPSYDFPCNSAWGRHNGLVKCSSFGGKDNVLELADAGGWTHAYQEIAVVPDAVYRVSGEFYAQKQGECDGSAAVKWCSPSVVICPGKYTGEIRKFADLPPIKLFAIV